MRYHPHHMVDTYFMTASPMACTYAYAKAYRASTRPLVDLLLGKNVSDKN